MSQTPHPGPAGSDLHRQLRDLVQQVGADILTDPHTFRAALDDFLDERAATSGELNLLVDAVRLGALDRARQQLANGAVAAVVVDAQGDLLARDRGTGESRNARWAVAALGFALGIVAEGEVVARRHISTGLGAPSSGAPASAPAPAPAPPPPPTAAPPPPAPFASYPGQLHQPHQPSQPYGSWSTPVSPPPRRRTGLVVGAVLAALVLLGGGIAAAVTLAGGDDPEPRGGGSSSDSPTDETGATLGTGEADPFQSLAGIEELAGELFPSSATPDNSYASNWSTASSNIVDGETRRLSQSELDTATEWYARRVEGDERFYIFVRYLASDSTYEWSCDSYTYCDEVTSEGGLDALVIRQESEREESSTYYRDVVIPGDAAAGIPEITISENLDNQTSGQDAESVMAEASVLDLDTLIAALDDPRLRPPLPEELPPLPSWDACVYNAAPPSDCPEGLGSN